jgi:hypothetical protein
VLISLLLVFSPCSLKMLFPCFHCSFLSSFVF